MGASLGIDEWGERHERVEELFRAHAPTLLACAMRRGVQRADAEDAVSKTFPVRSCHFAEVPDDARPCLLGVESTVLTNQCRAERRQQAPQEGLVEVAPEALCLRTSANGADGGPAVATCVDLGSLERRTCELVGLEHLSYKQTGKSTDVSPEAA